MLPLLRLHDARARALRRVRSGSRSSERARAPSASRALLARALSRRRASRGSIATWQPASRARRCSTRMRDGELDILVGTQMVTKGHDLPNVTLVGVLNADAALSLPGLPRRRAQLPAARAGGRVAPGAATRRARVLIQTRSARSPGDRVRGHARRARLLRARAGAAPGARLPAVFAPGAGARRRGRGGACAGRCRAPGARWRAQRSGRTGRREVLGPAPAPLARLRNRYRYRFLLRAAERAALREALLAVARAPAIGRCASLSTWTP